MQTIQLTYPFDLEHIPSHSVVLTLGFFDGVHRGHQNVITNAKRISQQLKIPLALMTFDIAPKLIFQNLSSDQVKYLTLIDRKRALMEQFGVDILYVVNFESISSLSPQTFVDECLIPLHPRVVVAGFDYTYGKPELANMQTLIAHSRERFEVVEVAELQQKGQKIGSRHIEEAIRSGDIEEANQQLGYTFQIEGTVVPGFQRGRELGFPTANLQIDPRQVLPGVGVYITKAKYQDTWYNAMTSVGYNVTFGDSNHMTVETHILDFDRDIYDETLTLEWHHFIRGEIAFNSVDELKAQLAKDAQTTRDYFAVHAN